MSIFENLKNQVVATKLEAELATKKAQDAQEAFDKYVTDTLNSMIGKKMEIRYIPEDGHAGMVIVEGELGVSGVKSCAWLPSKWVSLRTGKKYTHINFDSIISWKVLNS